MAVDPDFVLTFLILSMAKIGVSAVKINKIVFLSFIFSVLENETALILWGVTSQEVVFILYVSHQVEETWASENW